MQQVTLDDLLCTVSKNTRGQPGWLRDATVSPYCVLIRNESWRRCHAADDDRDAVVAAWQTQAAATTLSVAPAAAVAATAAQSGG